MYNCERRVLWLTAGLLTVVAVSALPSATPSTWRLGVEELLARSPLPTTAKEGLSRGEYRVEEVIGGLSNRAYLLHGESDGFFVRVPGDMDAAPEASYSTLHLVDRSMEERCALAAGSNGLSPELVAMDTSSGIAVSAMVADARPLNSEELHGERGRQRLLQVSAVLQRFHSIQLESSESTPIYTPLSRILNYAHIAAEVGVVLPEAAAGIIAAAATVGRLLDDASTYDDVAAGAVRPIVPLHCDLNGGNLLLRSDGSLSLVDFEYCSLGHWHWDLASLALFAELDHDDELALLGSYVGLGDASALQSSARGRFLLARLRIAKVLIALVEALWALTMDATAPAIPFSAPWTPHASFAQYGESYLEEVGNDLYGADMSEWVREIGEYRETLRSAARELNLAAAQRESGAAEEL